MRLSKQVVEPRDKFSKIPVASKDVGKDPCPSCGGPKSRRAKMCFFCRFRKFRIEGTCKVMIEGEVCWRIPITREKYIFVSDEDYERVMEHSWQAVPSRVNGLWYAHRMVWSGSSYEPQSVHVFILGAPPEGMEIDHKNRNGLDNRRANIRFATRQQNLANQGIGKLNTSGYRGVIWNKDTQRWRCSIFIDKKRKYLGFFDEAEEAARAFDEEAKKHHGDFANLNFPDS